MNRRLVVASALTVLVAGRGVRGWALDERSTWPKTVDVPYAPSPAAAPFVTLGYHEVGADLMWIRMIAYLGGTSDTSDGVRDLVEATLALDDHFRPAYDIGGLAIEAANYGVDNDSHLAAISILERGMKRFPDHWKYPYLAGQIYLTDLVSDDPALTRAWTERGVAMLERAVRLPDAPAKQAATAAHLMDKLGKHEAAVQRLREVILITTDESAKRELIERLAKLEAKDAADVAIAMLDARKAFDDEWQGSRPALPASMFLLLGPRRNPYLAPADLAFDRDLIGANPPEHLEPLFDDEPVGP
jgi:hypothetical protein